MKEEKIIKLQSVYKEFIWGGTKIRDVLHKDTGGLARVGECWDISTHPSGRSIIAEGQFAGKTLSEYFDIEGWDMLGDYGTKYHQLPVLIKYIDAKDNLSIQVHPDDEYARAHENDSGKNEMWFILDANKGAFIYLGFNKNVTREEVENSIANDSIEKLLNKVYVKKGETYFIPAGTVHAIGKGCLICEIQQTSNVTYRLYDYKRPDINGKMRELHVDKAMEVINFNFFDITKYSATSIARVGQYLKEMLTECDRCSILRYEATGEFTYTSTHSRVKFVIVYSGIGTLTCEEDTVKIRVGEAYFINSPSIKLTGKCKAHIINL